MTKTIHIHIHRAKTSDADWDESKHKRAGDGQFGSGGGAVVPSPPRRPSAAPKAANPHNVAVQLAGRKQQLAELQKDMKTGKYSQEDMKELKTKEASLQRMIANYSEKSSPKAPAAKKSATAPAATKQAEDPVKKARWHEEEAGKLHAQAQKEYAKHGVRTDEYVRLKKEAQRHTNVGADLINQAVAKSKG